MDSNLIVKFITDLLWVILGFVIGFTVTNVIISNKKYDKEQSEIDLSVKVIKQGQAISWYRYALKILADRGEEFANTALDAGERYYGK